MRVLQIHCSSFTYTVTRSTPAAEPPKPQTAELKDVLVCFICFEKRDEGRETELVTTYVTNLRNDVSRLNCERVLLHPYAHLSNNLGSPNKARDFMNNLYTRLTTEMETHKSPFGWYKAFHLECKGHPLAEAYREF